MSWLKWLVGDAFVTKISNDRLTAEVVMSWDLREARTGLPTFCVCAVGAIDYSRIWDNNKTEWSHRKKQSKRKKKTVKKRNQQYRQFQSVKTVPVFPGPLDHNDT